MMEFANLVLYSHARERLFVFTFILGDSYQSVVVFPLTRVTFIKYNHFKLYMDFVPPVTHFLFDHRLLT